MRPAWFDAGVSVAPFITIEPPPFQGESAPARAGGVPGAAGVVAGVPRATRCSSSRSSRSAPDEAPLP